jgi:nucleoside-diphosphate-sugar epimerase
MSYSEIVRDDVRGLLVDLRAELLRSAGGTILITGAAGFLMSYLVEVLSAWNRANDSCTFRILALDNFKTGLPDRLAHLDGDANVRVINHDVTQPFAAEEPVHWIIHGASIASPTFYRRYPLETLDANVGGTRSLLELSRCNPVRGFLFISTSEIYGDPDPAHIPTAEEYRGFVSCTGVRACYDEGKRLGETLAMIYFRLYGLPVKIVRPFNVYGPGLRLNDKRVLPDFMSKVISGEPIVLLSDGRPTRAFCYVSDAASLILRILFGAPSGEAFNVGNDEREISMLELARLTAKVGAEVLGGVETGVLSGVSEEADYLYDNPQRRLANLAKARRQFPEWTPRIGLEEGLGRAFRHCLENMRTTRDESAD